MQLPSVSRAEWLRRLQEGDRRLLARVVTMVEEDSAGAEDFLQVCAEAGVGAPRIGLTGAPGVGKSSLAAELISAIRTEESTVGVIAVDPSSPITQGALLGDRIRLQEHAGDSGVYIRSIAARGHLGGLSEATPRIATVLDAAGFDVLIIETVGVGQSEVEVMKHVDTTVVVVTPGWGDGIQGAKAGILEIGDVFVVNKADLAGSANARRELETTLSMGPPRAWRPPVVETAATRREGITGLWQAIRAHQAFLRGEEEARAQRIEG